LFVPQLVRPRHLVSPDLGPQPGDHRQFFANHTNADPTADLRQYLLAVSKLDLLELSNGRTLSGQFYFCLRLVGHFHTLAKTLRPMAPCTWTLAVLGLCNLLPVTF